MNYFSLRDIRIVNITGANGPGKGIMSEQFAIKQAVETPSPFLMTSLRQRALAMDLELSEIFGCCKL